MTGVSSSLLNIGVIREIFGNIPDVSFVKNAREVPLMNVNLDLGTKENRSTIPFIEGSAYPNKLIEVC